MKMLNCFALIVRSGARYIEWAVKVFGKPLAEVRKETSNSEPTVCLLAEFEVALPGIKPT